MAIVAEILLAERSRENAENDVGSESGVVAGAINEAVKARRPKTRYAVGKYARPMTALRRFGGDRVFDRVVDFMV